MRYILSLLFSTFLFCSCKEKVNSVQDVMNALEPEKQSSSIDPTVDNVIKGEKGTQIFIPANALKFKDGTSPNGKVRIEFKEFFSTSDFISNNLSTVSDSFLLETNGMLYISAMADGKELVVDNSKSLAIAFPKADSTKRMELFYGDNTDGGNINWQPAFQGGEGIPDPGLADSSLYEYRFSVCGHTIGIGDDSVMWHLNHRDSTIFLYIKNNFKTTDTAVINALCERGETAGFQIEIDDKGKIVDINLDNEPYWNTTSKRIQKLFADFLYTIPPFKTETMAKKNFRYFELQICCHNMFNWDKYKERFDKKYSQYQDKAIQKIDPTELKYYVLLTTKLGWINCDRFYDDQREKIDYIVKVPAAKDANVMIVFDEIKSIMNGVTKGTDIVFKNVPVSSKIKVIGISYQDGKPLLSKMPAIVSRESFTLTGFKEFTLKELEKELNN